MIIAPQPGPQTAFLSTTADIAIYGGAAGGGKSWGLMIEPLRHLYVPQATGVIFRRTLTDITKPGALWAQSEKIYRPIGAQSREGAHLDWVIPGGLTLKFAHMQHEKNKYDWQGAEITYAGFDELTHFTRSQFFYILSRLRSMTGVPGYVRATCNPDAESWVADFISWWIEQDEKSDRYGLPIPERDGVLRWFIRQGDDLVWADSKEELIEQFGDEAGGMAKSVTFIAANVYDNKLLLEKDPGYLAWLKSLDRVEQARLLGGNWKVKASAGDFFKRSDFKIIPANEAPPCVKIIRYWDRAATKPTPEKRNPDWTAGPKMGITANHQIVIFHCERFREDPLGNETRIKNMAAQDTARVTIGIEQDPGQAGKADAENYIRLLRGYDVRAFPVHKDKETRARGYAAQVRAGNVFLVEGDWNEAFLKEHEAFPPDKTKKSTKGKDGAQDEDGAGKDDQVDAASGGFNFLVGDNVGTFGAPSGQGTQTIAGGLRDRSDQW